MIKNSQHRLRDARLQDGFIGLIFVLVVSSIILVLAVAASLRSIENLQASYWKGMSGRSSYLAQSCLEDGLIRLRRNWINYSYTLPIDGDFCTINIQTTATQANLASKGTAKNFNYNLTETITSDFSIMNRQE